MNVCNEFKIPIYEILVQVVLVEDIWKYYQSTNSFGIKEEVDNYKALTIDAFDNPEKECGYYVIFKNEDYSVGCIAHEAFHIVSSILKRIKTPLNDSTEETYAYLLTYLVDMIVENLLQLKLKRQELLELNI